MGKLTATRPARLPNPKPNAINQKDYRYERGTTGRQVNQVNKKLEHVIAKPVAAFMASEAGTLFIGGDDHGNATGLELDYGTLKKTDRDGFQLHLGNIVDSYLGKDVMKPWKLDWLLYGDKQICHVQFRRANKPVYVTSEGKEKFFVRKEGPSQPLSRAEEHEWNRGRF